MKILNNAKKGFTLIELLVVIAIIGILTGVVLVAINPAEMLKESRDSTRISDLDNVRKALDLAVAGGDITLSPGTGDSKSGTRAVDGTGWVSYTMVTSPGLGKYLPTLPIDPQDSTGGTYYYAAGADGYELNATFESTKYQARYTTDGGNSATKYEVGTDPGLDLIN